MQKIDREKKLGIVKKIFKEDVVAFSRFFYPHYCKKETPDFHRQLFDTYKNCGNRIAIAAPRGHGKSTVTDLFYLSHEILHNDKVNFVLIVSDTYTQSAMFLNTIKTEFETNDKLKAFYNIEIERSSVNEIVVNGKLIKAIGANQKVRGLLWRENRPNLIIVDDLENDELVRSKERRYNLSNWFNASLVPSLSDNGRIIMIGTVLHYDSLLENILGGEQYKEFETKRFKAIMDNKPLWEDLWSIEKLEELKNSYIAKGKGFLYYQEYMNEPVSDENRKFKVEKLKYYEDNALENKMIVNYCCIDRAYSLDKTADFTGIVVVGVDRENNWFVRHAERFKGLESDLITKIFDLKKYYNLENIGIEQKAFEYTLKPALEQRMRETNNFFSVQPLRDLGQSKGLRIEGLLPRYEIGTIFFKREQYDLIDELITYPFARNDDLCLVGDTMIATSTGNKKIKDVKAGEFVLTPFGNKMVLNSKFTGRKFIVDNVGLQGTKEHKIFSGNRFDNLDTIGYNEVSKLNFSELVLWKYKILLYSMEQNTDLWAARENIILANHVQMLEGSALKDFTLRFGNFITTKKLKEVIRFTIKTVILLITTLKTWSVFKLGNICRNILKEIGKTKSLGRGMKKYLIMQGHSQLYGIKVMKEKSGIKNTALSVGKTAKNIISFVTCAVMNLVRHLKGQSFVEEIVKCEVGEKETKKGGERFAGKAMKREVYNLTVDGAGVYYANGILVSNCDALSYCLTIAEYKQERKQYIPKY